MKIAVTGDRVILVTDEGKDKWQVSRVLACGIELTGFGGENHLYILLQSWQSGDYHVTVCHCQVDSNTIVKQGLFKEKELTAAINTFIKETSPSEL